MHPEGEIYAIDEREGTTYILFRTGLDPVSADWPQHLLHVAPGAKQMGTLGGSEVWHVGLNGHCAQNPPIEGFRETQVSSMMSSMNVVGQRTSRLTGSLILIIDNRDGSFEEVSEGMNEQETRALRREASWATLCEAHGNYCLHQSYRLAALMMSCSDEWCEQCERFS